MKIKFILILFVLSFSAAISQRLYKISVQIEGREETLSYFTKSSIDYVSSKEIAELLSAGQFYNSEASKLEIKFQEFSLKLSSQNQFIIISRKADISQKVFQLPVSTLFVRDDIFIPLVYSIDYINFCFGRKLIYDNRTKNLKVTNEAFDRGTIFVSKPIAEQEKPTEPTRQIVKENLKYDINSITIEEKSNGTLIRLKAGRKLPIPRHSISNGVLYIFLPAVSISPDIKYSIKPVGLVKRIEKTIVSEKNIQLEFSLEEGYSTTEAFQDVESNDILITIHNKLFTTQQLNSDDVKSKWIFDNVVIDAGHGGKDPGAIGITGTKEKNINLAVALKLGRLIEKNLPGVNVVYTRKTDEFVELYKRGKIANENGGKLFISIHCNSTEAKDISYRGFEVYLLRPGRTSQAIRIAEFENSVIKYEENPERYQKLTDENFILVSMAHSQFMRYSEKFSDLLDQEWKNSVNIPTLGVKQAGFYVLVGASMPGVLIENGFLSNRKDELHLVSTEGQNEIAEAIFNSIKKYKENYDKELGK